jgi:stringent starvation protein B
MSESSTKPYFIRALHEWCTDNGYTPHIVVQVDENTRVPRAFISDGQITLNLGLLATNKLDLGNDYVSFQARFGGKTEDIWVPTSAVSAIFARETGAGMGFEVGDAAEADTDGNTVASTDDKNGTENSAEDSNENINDVTDSDITRHASIKDVPSTEAPPPKRPHLSIVK